MFPRSLALRCTHIIQHPARRTFKCLVEYSRVFRFPYKGWKWEQDWWTDSSTEGQPVGGGLVMHNMRVTNRRENKSIYYSFGFKEQLGWVSRLSFTKHKICVERRRGRDLHHVLVIQDLTAALFKSCRVAPSSSAMVQTPAPANTNLRSLIISRGPSKYSCKSTGWCEVIKAGTAKKIKATFRMLTSEQVRRWADVQSHQHRLMASDGGCSWRCWHTSVTLSLALRGIMQSWGGETFQKLCATLRFPPPPPSPSYPSPFLYALSSPYCTETEPLCLHPPAHCVFPR